MRSLVVYESMFGTTREVAEAVGAALGAAGEVRVVEVGELAAEGGAVDADLLVVGGPTHAFSMSRPQSRKDAATKFPEPLVSTGIGVREWLEGLTLTAGQKVAAFDTKTAKPNLPGSAGKPIEKGLRKAGGRPVARTESFKVESMRGLVAGEAERASAWGAGLVSAVQG